MKSLPEPRLGGGAPTAETTVATSSGLCGNDRECQACSAALLNKLIGSGLLQGDEQSEVSKRLGLDEAPQRRGCEKYRFGKLQAQFSRVAGIVPPSAARAKEALNDTVLDNLVKQLQQKGEENWNKTHQSDPVRSKRQSGSKQGSTLGMFSTCSAAV